MLVTKAGKGTLSVGTTPLVAQGSKAAARPATDTFGRVRPRRLLVRYAAGLTFAYVLTAAEVVAIVVSLAGRSVVTAAAMSSRSVAVGLVGTATCRRGRACCIVAPTLRWMSAGPRPTDAQLRTATERSRRQSAITVAPWVSDSRSPGAAQPRRRHPAS